MKDGQEIDLIETVTVSNNFETHGFCMLLTTLLKSEPGKHGIDVIYFWLRKVSILKYWNFELRDQIWPLGSKYSFFLEHFWIKWIEIVGFFL